MDACGAADIIMEMYGPFVSDDILFRRLEDRLL